MKIKALINIRYNDILYPDGMEFEIDDKEGKRLIKENYALEVEEETEISEEENKKKNNKKNNKKGE